MLGIFGQLSRGQKAFGLAFVSVLGVVLLATVYYLWPTASNKGYAPTQPIPFSHKLHAGTHKMDCRYCHVAVTESRHATVPAANVCMNCHKVVKTDSPHIQKLTKLYNEGKPIEWIRVHRLPDHARFNHRAHVTKGIDCKVCHGDVRGMEKVTQVNTLTMGWCLECHRGQDVPTSVISTVKPSADPDEPGDLAPYNCSTCHY